MIKSRHTGQFKDPIIITDAISEIVKQSNTTTNALDKRVAQLETNPVIYTGDEVPSNKIGKDGDIFIHRTTKVVYLKLGGVWN